MTEINEEIHFEENSNGFSADLVIHQDKLQHVDKTKLSLEKEHIFNMPSSLIKTISSAFKRKNEIFYCVSTKEMSIDIKDVSGKVYLPLITKQEIRQKLSKIDPSIAKKISMIHLGAARGNLCYGKFMFTVYPKFALSLESKNLDKTLSFIHQFERSDLMNSGDKVFTVTYLIGYALANSHHSVKYRRNANIEIDEVFSDIGQIEESPFCEISPSEENWTIDIARGKKNIVPTLSRNIFISDSSEVTEDKDLLRSMSKRIDTLSQKLSVIYDNEQ